MEGVFYTWQILSFADGILLKLCTVTLLVYVSLYAYTRLKAMPKDTRETIEGIPIEELLDFLYKENGFPREKSVEYFGIATTTHSKISKKLQECQILKKVPPYNKLILTDEWNRNQIASSLKTGVSTPFIIRRG